MVHEPTQSQERIEILDILRGFALFGVLMVNMSSFKSPVFYQITAPMYYKNILDQGVAWFIQLFAVAKFYTTFSFLFGIGFYLFMERATKRELDGKKLYKRRLLFLLVLGLVHLGFIWSGDILHSYALGGLLLLSFRNKEADQLKSWIGFFILLTLLLMGILYGLQYLANTSMGSGDIINYQSQQAAMANRVFSTGSYKDIVSFRMGREIPAMLFNNLLVIPMVMPLFLMGFFIGKKGILKYPFLYIEQIKKVFFYTLGIGILLTLLLIFFIINPFNLNPIAAIGLKELVTYLSGISMSFLYITSLILLVLKGSLKKILKPLAYVGRMALSNYLLQSVLGVSLFYGFGLGYFGKVGPFWGLIITITIFIGQIFLSKLWLSYYSYGPMEWIWRCYTYQQSLGLKMRKKGTL